MTIDPSVIVRHGGRTVCTAARWGRTDEWCDDAKLYAPVSGTGWVSVGARRMELRSQALYLVPPHHRISYGTDSRVVIDWLHFTPVSPVVDAKLSALTAVQQLPRTAMARWRPTCRLIASFMDQPTPALTCRMHALLLELMGIILADMKPEDARVWSAYERLMPALRFMDEHVNDPPRLAEIATQVHLSPEHFQRLFRLRFRATPSTYLRRRRMAKAHRLLSEGVLPVKRVAAACGFEDPYYFSRVFRSHYGCTPRAVRQGRTHVVP